MSQADRRDGIWKTTHHQISKTRLHSLRLMFESDRVGQEGGCRPEHMPVFVHGSPVMLSIWNTVMFCSSMSCMTVLQSDGMAELPCMNTVLAQHYDPLSDTPLCV